MMYMSKKVFQTGMILIGFMISFSITLQAQNTKRAFKLLEKADYEKSRGLLLDALSENREDPAALLGLTLMLADDKSPYYDLIAAWGYARTLKANLDKITTEESEYIGEYFYNVEVRHISWPVKRKIEYAVETVEAKLIKYVREENNLDIVYKVLKEFPDFRYYENVMHIRNQLEFRKYEKQNTLEGYLEFIRNFPDAAQIDKAIKYRNQLAFENACNINSVEAYKKYIDDYPDALEINAAIKKIHSVAFENAKKVNTIQSFDKFMADYPDALEISDARLIQKQLLYEYAKKIQTLQAYNDFIRKYPEGQQYIDIFNLKSLDNGMRFIAAHPLPTNNVQWARSFENEENEELSACMAVDTLNSYIIGGTVFRSDTGSTDAWILKLSSEGKMIWNKYVGEEFNDEINLLAISNQNEILGAGYTHTGIDSSSRESWLFKLGKDGEKLWSKKLGKMNINCMTISTTGSIFLGGFLVNDSLERLYSVIVLNESGKRLWSRTYTGQGEIVQITECPDQKIVLTGTHWRAKIDPKGYLIWESPFSDKDSIVTAQVLPRGEICYLGFRNGSKLVFIKTGSDNKPLLDKELSVPEVQLKVNSMIKAGNNQLITLLTFKEHQSLNWINTINCEITASARLPYGIKATAILCDFKNNLLLEACNAEIIVIKNSGVAF